MKKNVGGFDKILRIVVGLGLLSLIFVLEGDMRWWGLVGLVPLGTALVGWCPLYVPLGLSSCGKCCGGGCKSKEGEEASEDAPKAE